MSAMANWRVRGVQRVAHWTGSALVCAAACAVLCRPVAGQTAPAGEAVSWGNGAALVRWTTAVPATSRVNYGTNANALGKRASDPALTTEHAVMLRGLTAGAVYYYTVTSAAAGGQSTTLPPGRRTPPRFVAALSLWGPDAKPAQAAGNDPSPMELGMAVQFRVAGDIAGIRFYKGPGNTGTHTGHLWTTSGELLASVTFTNETAEGWQQASFATPVRIAAQTSYVISYHAPDGHYASDETFVAAAGSATSPLRAVPAEGSGVRGLYRYGPGGAFPDQPGNAGNYWVDVVFVPAGPVAAAPAATSLWPEGTVPELAAGPDARAAEVGVQFESDAAGEVTGIRFYKGPRNTGTHYGRLWSASGLLLATATFSDETAAGWQQVSFASPVAVQAHTTYIASYYAPAAHDSSGDGFFAAAEVDNPPLRALSAQNAGGGGNGVYLYGSGGGFPSRSDGAKNFWVDVVFRASPAASILPAADSGVAPGTAPYRPASRPVGVPAGSSSTELSNRSVFANGIGANPHSVSLTWRPSITQSVAAYNIYRGDQSGGPYALINVSLVPRTQYVDTNVIAGQTYYYVTTAIDIDFNESAYSNEAAATVPLTAASSAARH